METKTKRPLRVEFTKGLIKENPLLRLMLGTCPSLAVTTSASNGIGMGLATTFVLLCSNIVISLMRNIIPEKVRIPAYITVIASFVTILQFLLQAYMPALNESLGIFIPLITVNCIILGRAEAFAGKNPLRPSIFDGLGMGTGFTAALVLMGTIREVLGNGSIFDIALPFIGEGHMLQPMLIMILPPGGFMVFGLLIAIAQHLTRKFYAKHPDQAIDDNIIPGSLSERTDCAMCGASDSCSNFHKAINVNVPEALSDD